MRTFLAPGRVNLIGEHTDYTGGLVMPAAIDFATSVSVEPLESRRIVVRSECFAETTTIDLDSQIVPMQGHWSDYIAGVAAMLERAGHRLRGAHLNIASTIPMGAGLSSSAALEVGTAMALAANSGISLAPVDIAKLCQRAENEFAGSQCGIMDQFASCHGRAGHAILLDCRSLDFTYVPLPAGVTLAVCNTMVRHELASNEYNLRREQCEAGSKALGRPLRDAALADFDADLDGISDPLIRRRCRHVVTENQRAIDGAAALRQGDVNAFGTLMAASHRSLRDDFEVSCPELDLMVDLARGIDGVYGSRMTGGGFGGCTINLVNSSHAARFGERITLAYEQRSGRKCEVYLCSAVDGAAEESPLRAHD